MKEHKQTIRDEVEQKNVDLISTRVRINDYALEELILGRVSPGEKIALNNFLRTINKQNIYDEEMLSGAVLDDHLTIREKDKNYFYDLFYSFHAKLTYFRQLLCDGFSDYIRQLYPLFCEILETTITTRDILICEKAFNKFTDQIMADFLGEVFMKQVKVGDDVSGLLKHRKKLPYFIKQLVKRSGSKYILKNDDIDSFEFKLAVICGVYFYYKGHSDLFELKAKEWWQLAQLKQ